MKYWFPYPLLALLLLIIWLLVNQSVSVGQILLGSVLSLSLCWVVLSLDPQKSRIRKPALLVTLLGHIILDVARSNLAVARVILRGRHRKQTSGFLRLQLELQDRNALAVLACILAATPGTIWLEFDTAKRTLLLHILDLVDEQHWIDLIKMRYEAPLREIFE